MNRGRAKLVRWIALLAWLAAWGPLRAAEAELGSGVAGRMEAVPARIPAGGGVDAMRRVATAPGAGGMVVEVELLEAGGLPMTQLVEVRWEEVSGASAWWLLAAAPLLLVFAVRGHGRRGLRAGPRMG